MDVLKRNNVNIRGQGSQPLVFAHGFGCDQQMWRFVAPAFEATHRVVLFDHVGCGKSDLASFSEQRHGSLDGYAEDLAEVLDAADLHDVTLVGHSVGSMIAALASLRAPQRVSQLVLLGPSARYLNDAPLYTGGFERQDIDSLLDMMEANTLGWAGYLAPMVMGERAPAELTTEVREAFCSNDPYITRRFAQLTFLGDNRADLARVQTPTLVIQCDDDAIAPLSAGRYVHEHIAGSRFEVLQASGHCPHMTHPEQTIALIRSQLAAPQPKASGSPGA